MAGLLILPSHLPLASSSKRIALLFVVNFVVVLVGVGF